MLPLGEVMDGAVKYLCKSQCLVLYSFVCFFFLNKIKSILSQSGEAGHSKTSKSGFLALTLTGGMTFEKLICHLNLSFLF